MIIFTLYNLFYPHCRLSTAVDVTSLIYVSIKYSVMIFHVLLSAHKFDEQSIICGF